MEKSVPSSVCLDISPGLFCCRAIADPTLLFCYLSLSVSLCLCLYLSVSLFVSLFLCLSLCLCLSGKSSILQALFRVVETSSGSVSLCGADTRHVPLPRLRSCLAIIPQDPVLLKGSIR